MTRRAITLVCLAAALVLSDAHQRLILAVSYLENYEDQLKPVFDRVLSSLTFGENDPVSG